MVHLIKNSAPSDVISSSQSPKPLAGGIRRPPLEVNTSLIPLRNRVNQLEHMVVTHCSLHHVLIQVRKDAIHGDIFQHRLSKFFCQ